MRKEPVFRDQSRRPWCRKVLVSLYVCEVTGLGLRHYPGRSRQARHPQVVTRSPGAGGHGSPAPAPHGPVLLLGRQVTWPCSWRG